MGQFLPDVQKHEPKNAFFGEWKGGAQGALISAGGFVVSGLFLMLLHPPGMGDDLDFGIGLLPLMCSMASVPFLVSWGVNRAGARCYPDGKYWQALAGALAGTLLSIPVNSLIYTLTDSATTPLLVYIAPFIVDPFVIIPIASLLTYNLLNRHRKTANLASFLNVNKGMLEIGTPVPVVYPDPMMQGRICSQISLVTITF